jgi:hypothetical protein
VSPSFVTHRMSWPGTPLPLMERMRPPPTWTSRPAKTSVPMPPGSLRSASCWSSCRPSALSLE